MMGSLTMGSSLKRERLLRHVAAALNGPIVAVFEQDDAEPASDAGVRPRGPNYPHRLARDRPNR